MLEVMTSGSMVWRYRYSFNRKQQPLVTIGDYPAVTLQDARIRARRYAEIVAGGVSPISDAKKDRGAAKTLDSVRAFADFWYESEIATKSLSYRTVTRRALDKDIFPAIGNKALAESEWSESDLDEGVWRIPAERMKRDREHWVFLSAQAVSICVNCARFRTASASCSQYGVATKTGLSPNQR